MQQQAEIQQNITSKTPKELKNEECKDIGNKTPKEIQLVNKKGIVTVDDEDYQWLMSLGNWTLYKANKGKKLYARVRNSEGEFSMHKLIMEKHFGKSSKCISHLDGNGLNNQKSNLVHGFIATWADDLTGKQFNRWTVLGLDRTEDGYKRFWKCRCSCENETEKSVLGYTLVNNVSKSCGCLRFETYPGKTHGESNTPTYTSWSGMHTRCLNVNCKAYKYYGGRGIKICDRWLNSFENFLEDMGERPDNTTIHRIDSNRDYEPNNCVWANSKIQSRSKTNTIYVKYKEEVKSLLDFAEDFNLPYRLVWQRLFRRGWTIEETFNTPILKHGYTIKGNDYNATFIEFEGKRQSIRAWAKEVGLNHQTLWSRIKADWDIEYALTEPPLKGGEWNV